ncbi:hypothetical protein [Dyella sp. AD56]|uniref:hypothetical protein n=1 Tax=Dyella sp. AD56 TaxID=1528744 RepID=UPI000C85D37B|nr:hypothetical protein [Dyella sp. AD56]
MSKPQWITAYEEQKRIDGETGVQQQCPPLDREALSVVADPPKGTCGHQPEGYGPDRVMEWVELTQSIASA